MSISYLFHRLHSGGKILTVRSCVACSVCVILIAMNREYISEQHLAAWRVFLRAQALITDQIDHDLLAAKRPPLSWYDVLIELYEAPERRLRMYELARRVVLSRSGLTRLVDRLESEGLLVRDRSSTDRRGAYAVITVKGITALRRAWPVYAQGIMQYFAQFLSLEEAQVIEKVFERILEAPEKE